MNARTSESNWVRELRLSPCPRAQLVCFPHAGGTANFFRGWSRALPWDIDLLALQYPGRDERFGEPCLSSIDALAGPAADALQRYAHVPLVLFGHSLGAALAYEVALRLEARGNAPIYVAVSALPPPHRQRLSDLHLQPDDALLGDVARLSGEHAALLADPEMRAIYLPMILLATGVAEFGRAIYQYETLTKATRDAARYLSIWLPTDSAYPVTAAQCLVVYGSTTCGSAGTELVPGLTTSMVTICDASHTTGCSDASDPAQFSNLPTYDANNNAASGTATGAINVVEVKIKGYKYQPIPAYPGLPSITFGNIITVMRQVS